MTELMPTVVLGHGNPMNAITDNAYSRGWATPGRSIPRPRAILVASAHWYAPVPQRAGAWSVLVHIYPNADIPVVQLSIDKTQPPKRHYEPGKMLSPLREEGVLMLGSGNVVHNLASSAWETPSIPPFDWAARFEREVRQALLQGDDAPLIEYENPAPTHRCPSQRRTITCRFSMSWAHGAKASL